MNKWGRGDLRETGIRIRRRSGHSFEACGGGELGDGGKIAFRRTVHDFLCIPGQELASECTVQPLKRESARHTNCHSG